jgi:hypothetical protein
MTLLIQVSMTKMETIFNTSPDNEQFLFLNQQNSKNQVLRVDNLDV